MTGRNFTVLGAGIVGICCALYLQRDGHTVTLIDRDAPGAGASYGNAGILSAGSVHPVGMPGIWKKGLKMLFDPLAPMTVRPSYAMQIAPWLWGMFKASRPDRVEEQSKALAALSQPCVDHMMALLESDDSSDLVVRNGSLTLYESEEAFAAGIADNAYRDRRGTPYEILGPEEIAQMDPVLSGKFTGAIYQPTAGYTTNPQRLSSLLAARFQQDGGTVLRREVTDLDLDGDRVTMLKTADGDISVDNLVIAMGAYSRRLTARLGSKVPLDTERGYHAILPNADLNLKHALLLPARGCAVTPMETGLRIAGTVEFAGLDAPPDERRAEILIKHGKELFPEVDAGGADTWMGRRPSLPDSLPVISSSPHIGNAYFAYGHGHLGLSQSAITGRLIADIVAGRPPAVDPAPFRVDRF